MQIGETLPIPEIVAVGGQSDGKSSLMEALLGFRFNIRATEMGTRRPLVVQMVHDPDAATPRCRLQDEDAETYGPVIGEPLVLCLPSAAILHYVPLATRGKSNVARPCPGHASSGHPRNCQLDCPDDAWCYCTWGKASRGLPISRPI